MNIRFSVPQILAGLFAAVLASGCSRPQLVSRAMTPMETGWAQAIQRSYPGWQPPYYLPKRSDWTPRPRTEPVMLPFPGREDPAASVSASARVVPVVANSAPVSPVSPTKETVVNIPLGGQASSVRPPVVEIVPPVRVDAAQRSPATPSAEPLAPGASSLDDVEFVPADTP